MKVTIEEIHEYLMGWYCSEHWTDVNMALDSGYTEQAAYIIWSAGAIDSSMCYESGREIEKAIEKLMKKYGVRKQNKDYKECFGNAIVYIRPSDNEHAFIKNDYVDYLVSDEEMRRYGYIPEAEYYKMTK